MGVTHQIGDGMYPRKPIRVLRQLLSLLQMPVMGLPGPVPTGDARQTEQRRIAGWAMGCTHPTGCGPSFC